MKIINFIIRRLGKDDYTIDVYLNHHDLFIVIRGKLLMLFRGFWLQLFLKRSKGLIFVGKNTKIIHCNKIISGKSLMIGDNVEINALSKQGVIIGNNVSILKNTIIECTGVLRNIGDGLEIGNNVGIAQNCFIQVRGKVIIGNNVILGPNVSIFSENHNFADPNVAIKNQGETRIGVVIHDGVWIGTRVTILDGVTIGQNSIVAAGSVVNRDVPPFSIVAGIPATIIKQIK